MRVELLALARKSPHPAVPARPRKRGSPRSPREKERRPRRACNSMVKRDSHPESRTVYAPGDDLGRLLQSVCSTDRGVGTASCLLINSTDQTQPAMTISLTHGIVGDGIPA